jgi:hypothetical protein
LQVFARNSINVVKFLFLYKFISLIGKDMKSKFHHTRSRSRSRPSNIFDGFE